MGPGAVALPVGLFPVQSFLGVANHVRTGHEQAAGFAGNTALCCKQRRAASACNFPCCGILAIRPQSLSIGGDPPENSAGRKKTEKSAPE